MRPAAVLLLVAIAAAACDREARRLERPAGPQATTGSPPPRTENQPGLPGKGIGEKVASNTFDEGNAYDLAQGKRLFRWFNCAGCHAYGGGGMGPPLMDDRWIYGHEPGQIFATIMDGRPNGMPAFRGRVPEDQVWQLVGYVRSMSGLVPADAAPGRNDGLAAIEPELRRDRATPRKQGKP
jgi:cytochrome c oxidase cbb3-type subunit 3